MKDAGGAVGAPASNGWPAGVQLLYCLRLATSRLRASPEALTDDWEMER
jgi:hypothetical protein